MKRLVGLDRMSQDQAVSNSKSVSCAQPSRDTRSCRFGCVPHCSYLAAVVEALTRITGVGVWTAQMFLMFTLRRPDVFAPNDLGLKKAMANLYGLAMADSNQKFDAFAQRWSPYRSWASLHLWESLKPR